MSEQKYDPLDDSGYDNLPGAAEDRRTSEAAARRRAKEDWEDQDTLDIEENLE